MALHSRPRSVAANDYGVTPLFLAAINGSTEMADALLAAGANLTIRSAGGYTPLMWAVATFEPIPMTYKGLETEGEWNTFAGIPDRGAKLALISLLIAKGANPLLTASDGQTALMATCEGILENTVLLSEDKRLAAAQTALDHGVPLEAEDRGGLRAMHQAARGGYHGLITFLLAKGADLNPVSKPVKGSGLARAYQEGQSPLGLVEGTIDSIFYERPDTAAFLRTLGARSIGPFRPHDFDQNSPDAADKKGVKGF